MKGTAGGAVRVCVGRDRSRFGLVRLQAPFLPNNDKRLVKAPSKLFSTTSSPSSFYFPPALPLSGLLPYYFLKLTDPARAQEVDRCVYNNMFDNPECKNASIDSIKNVHFTVCQKPWSCYTHAKNVACTPFMDKWYELRREVSQ